MLWWDRFGVNQARGSARGGERGAAAIRMPCQPRSYVARRADVAANDGCRGAELP
jgi:hypothetical protein